MGNTTQSASKLEDVSEMYLGIHTLLSSFKNIQEAVRQDRKLQEELTIKDVKLLNKLHEAIKEYQA